MSCDVTMSCPPRCFVGSERAPASAARVSAAPSSAVVAAVPVHLPDNDDLLLEILLRLPPLPSSLPRASLVCRRWRRVVADPDFLRRFRRRHARAAPPLLGYFSSGPHGPVFAPTLAPPDRVPPERFSFSTPRSRPRPPAGDGERLFLLGCRHGLALLIDRRRLEAVVWDPVSGRRAAVAYPPELTTDNGAHCCRGTVLSASAAVDDEDDGLVGDGGHYLRPFKVVLVRTDVGGGGRIRVLVCVYASETARWGHAVSTVVPSSSVSNLPSVLVRDALCGFLLWPNGILEYDLERHSLGVVRTPKRRHPIDRSFFQVVRAQDGELGLAILTELGMEMELWARRRKASSCASDGGGDVDGGWVLEKTIRLDSLLSLPRRSSSTMDDGILLSARILGFDEDNNVIHVSTCTGAFAIRLDDSMQFTELFEVSRIGSYHSCHPYAGFYTGGGVPGLLTNSNYICSE